MLSKFGLVATNAKTVVEGQTFDRLTIVAVGQIPNTYRYYAICQCSCGSALKSIRCDGLISGAVTSCGCVQKERSTTHGLTKSRHYHRWHGMISRCHNENDANFHRYGARGIKVCAAWHDLPTFVSQLPPGYFKGAEIDRIDNDGDYEPGNVRWSTRQENTDNRRTGSKHTYLGKTQSLTTWAREFGLPVGLVWQRVNHFGWDIAAALTTPVLTADERMLAARQARWGGHVKRPAPTPRVEKTVELNGATVTIAQIAKLTGLPAKLLRKRIFERGWTPERAASTPRKD